MSDPILDQIERELRAMTEPNPEPTELWKRALEVSRAEERAGLVHPAVDRPTHSHHRRILYALNAVGVAALIALAVGVWTLGRSAQPTEGLESGASGMMAMREGPSGAAASESPFSSAPWDAEGDAPAMDEPIALAMDETPSLDDALRDMASVREAMSGPSLLGAESDALAAKQSQPEAAPGLAQMEQAFASGLRLEGGDASVIGAAPMLENAEIVIEVADIEAANRVLAELPDPALSEFNFTPYPAAPLADDGALAMQVNVAPARMNETLEKIRSLGRVVEQSRTPDSVTNRAQIANDLVAQTLGPSVEVLEKVVGAESQDAHARAHRGLGADEFEELESVRASIASLARRLDEARRSMNLSQIRVSFRQAVDADTIEE